MSLLWGGQVAHAESVKNRATPAPAPLAAKPAEPTVSLPQLTEAEMALARKTFLLSQRERVAAKALLPQLNPDHASTALLIAFDHLDDQQFELALRAVQPFVPLYRNACPRLTGRSDQCKGFPQDGALCVMLFAASGEASWRVGRYEEAVEHLEDSIRYTENVCHATVNPGSLRGLLISYTRLKKYPLALDRAMRGYALLPAGLARAEFAWNIANIHLRMNNVDEMYRWLPEALESEDHAVYFEWLAKTDRDFEELRQDERFKAFLRKYEGRAREKK